MTKIDSSTALSLIIPANNEQDCIETTVLEAHELLGSLNSPFEILVINDGSLDNTGATLDELVRKLGGLRVLTLKQRAGQSAALGIGLSRCTGDITILMDADGQNDPADIPALLDAMKNCDMCCGYRTRREDPLRRRAGAKLANAVRNAALKEHIIDTGCSLKAFKTNLFRNTPVWNGMHRFLGSLAAMQGATIAQVPVNHRPRNGGRSHYTNLGRLLLTIHDLIGVRWMKKRRINMTMEVNE